MKVMGKMMELSSDKSLAVKTAGEMVQMTEHLSAAPYTHNMFVVSLGLLSVGRHTRWIQQELEEVSSWCYFECRADGLIDIVSKRYV